MDATSENEIRQKSQFCTPMHGPCVKIRRQTVQNAGVVLETLENAMVFLLYFRLAEIVAGISYILRILIFKRQTLIEF